jgi:Tol biopolymer transport system component
VVALSIVGIGAWLLRGRYGQAPPARAAESLRMTRVTTSGHASLADISPDGRYVVHVVDEGGPQSLWIRQVATSSNVQIVPSGKVRFESITFSSDGNFVYYVANPEDSTLATIYQIPVLGGTPRKIASDIDSRVAFSPDGRRMAFHRYSAREGQSSVILMEADGSGERVLASLGPGGGFSAGG